MQYKCQCSQSIPQAPIHQLHPIRSLTPTQPVSNKLVPSSPLSQTPIKQLQPTQILTPLPHISTLPSYPLHHGTDSAEDETQPEQQEPEPELQEPEPEQQSELEIQRAKYIQITHDLRKAQMNLLTTFEKLKKDYSSRNTYH